MIAAERRRWTRQPPDVRRRQLLDAATSVIMERGYESMTMSEVADRAGVGKGTVYLYFDSKLALLVGMQDRYWERMLEVIEHVLETDGLPWRERLDRVVADLVAFEVREAGLYHALFHDTPTTGGEPLGAFTSLIAELLRRGAEAGAFDVPDAKLMATFLVSALHGTGAQLVHTPARKRREATAVLQELFRRTVGAA